MERNVRRRYSSRRTSTRKSTGTSDVDFKSRLLVQCMLCGIALAAVLLICIINTQFCNELRITLKNAITRQTDVDDLKNLAGTSKDKLSEAGDMLNSLFRFSNASDETDPYLNNSASEGVEAFSGAVVETEQNAGQITDISSVGQGFEFRIDEDILNEMNSRADNYAESKKASAPEPSFIPELR